MGWLSWYAFFLLFIKSQLLYCSSLSLSSSGPKCHPEERTALLQFSNSFSFNPTASQECPFNFLIFHWNTSGSCCTWSGVTCDEETGHVIGLRLTCGGLQGTISSNSSLFLLRHLQVLDLSKNDFKGSPISPEFGQFKNMTHLSLRYSNFSGYVPSEISHLSRLVLFELYESSTQVAGSKMLYMEADTFEGLAQKLTNLTTLVLSGVGMSSVPSASLMNFSSSTTKIVLNFCELRGEIPAQSFQLPNLKELFIDGNNLTGSLPRSNWSSQLEMLSLSFNSFNGQIPRSLFNLGQLTYLDLSFNNFVGISPDFSSYDFSEYPLRNFSTKLKSLSLSCNLLNGTIPPWLFEFPSLSYLDLSNNFMSGEIGRISLWEVGNDSLSYLNLSHNFLTKVDFLPRMNLILLDLRSNLLSGPFQVCCHLSCESFLHQKINFGEKSLLQFAT